MGSGRSLASLVVHPSRPPARRDARRLMKSMRASSVRANGAAGTRVGSSRSYSRLKSSQVGGGFVRTRSRMAVPSKDRFPRVDHEGQHGFGVRNNGVGGSGSDILDISFGARLVVRVEESRGPARGGVVGGVGLGALDGLARGALSSGA